MNPDAIDALARSLAERASRRDALATVLTAVLALTGTPSVVDARRRSAGVNATDRTHRQSMSSRPRGAGGGQQGVGNPDAPCLGHGRPCSGDKCRQRCCGKTSLPAKPFGTKARVCWCKGEGSGCDDRRECCSGQCHNGHCRGAIETGRRCNTGDRCVAGQCSFYTSLDGPDGKFCVLPEGEACDAQGDCVTYVCDGGACGAQNTGPAMRVAGIWGHTGHGGNDGEDPEFSYAIDVEVDPDGNVFVADLSNARVLKLGPDGLRLAAWGSNGSGGANGDPPRFAHPTGVAIDSGGYLYVADRDNHRVVKLSPEGLRLDAWGTDGSGGVDGNPPRFQRLAGIAVDAEDNVVVVDAGNNRVVKVSPEGLRLAAWGSQGSGGTDGNPPRFEDPNGIALDDNGNIYVADTFNHRVLKLSPDGLRLAAWGSEGSKGAEVGAAPRFHRPWDIAVDADGNVFVTDRDNHRVQKLDPDGLILAVWGQFGHDGSVGSLPQFDNPTGIAVDSLGNVYVSEGGNDRVQKLEPAF